MALFVSYTLMVIELLLLFGVNCQPSAFMLHSKGNGGVVDYCLEPISCDADVELLLRPCDIENVYQNWTFDEGRISSIGCDNRCIDVPGSAYHNGSALITYICTENANQQWLFEYMTSHYVLIRSAGNDKYCIAVPDDNFNSDVQLNLFQCFQRDNQLFYFEKDSISSDDSSLSGGSIFIIIFICLFVMYCLIGYIINGYKRKEWKEYKTNLPHYHTFWEYLPKLVIAGSLVSKEYLFSKIQRKSHNDQTQDLNQQSQDD